MVERISVAGLVSQIFSPSNRAPHYLGLLHAKSLAKGERVFKPLGGAIKLTPEGMEVLKKRFEATNFEEGMDARFYVEREQVESVLKFFSIRDGMHYELEPDREIQEELADENPILTRQEVLQITTSYRETVRETAGASPSARQGKETTHRLFFVFHASMPDAVYAKLENSPLCKILTGEELDKGFAADGSNLGGNFVK